MRNVLVLNAGGGEIHDVITWKDAITMCCRSCVRIHDYFDDFKIRTPSQIYRCPSVIILNEYKYIPFNKRVAVNKTNVLIRDEYTCQYCGRKLTNTTGTIDHVIPSSRGGQHDWKNVVAACKYCNNKKDDKTPKEAGMSLKIRPYSPTREIFLQNFVRKPEYFGWKQYFHFSA